MNKPKIYQEHINCTGCHLFENFDGEMMCMSLIRWQGGTPPKPRCYQYAPEFLAAIDRHQHLVETLGVDHPDANRELLAVMELAPEPVKAMMRAKARELDLIPEAHGYLDDGTPMFRLEDVPEKFGLSLEEAEESIHEFMSVRESMGLPIDGVLADPSLMHRKQ